MVVALPSHDLGFLFISQFSSLIVAGAVAALGSTLMEISISGDLVPSVIPPDKLAEFNGRFRQVDLATETCAPVIAGILLALPFHDFSLLGFFVIAVWNLLSFWPEFWILRSIFKSCPERSRKSISAPAASKNSLTDNLLRGWRAFLQQPIAPAIIAFAILWLSVLSPHGVLLAAYLKDGWHLPEWEIGVFRGLGAFFGLGATIVFPWVEKRMGLFNATLSFIFFQSFMVSSAFGFFISGGRSGEIGFLFCVLFSRIGLYGFSLGETQIRQTGIKEGQRGEVNGFASALTGVATLLLFAAGTLIPSTQNFIWLVAASVFCVLIATCIFAVWSTAVKSTPILTKRDLQAPGND